MDRLELLLFLPLLGLFLVLLTQSKPTLCRVSALALSGALFLLSLAQLSVASPFVAQKTFYTFTAGRVHIAFSLGADGLSAWLILLTFFLLIPSLIYLLPQASFASQAGLLYFLAFALVGVFTSTDLILFYLFWEVSLLPLFFLIGIFGSGQRQAVALKFFLYTFSGSIFLLLGILFLTFSGRVTSLQWADLLNLSLPKAQQDLLALLFAIGFAVKIPILPLHTWLPEAHTEAPVVGSVFLAGVLLKMGVYGFLRWLMPLFPEGMATLAPYLLLLGAFGAVYAGVVCYAQPDIKRLIAYSSVAHMGLVVLGLSSLTATGVEGAYLQMINHGISTGALFLLVGILYDRRHTRRIDAFGGIAEVMPRYAALFLLVSLSSLGLPGLNSFPGELLIFLGAWIAQPYLALFSLLALFLAAAYLLTPYRRIFHGPLTRSENESLSDLSFREWLLFLPLLAAIFFFGFFPQLLLHAFTPYLGVLHL